MAVNALEPVMTSGDSWTVEFLLDYDEQWLEKLRLRCVRHIASLHSLKANNNDLSIEADRLLHSSCNESITLWEGRLSNIRKAIWKLGIPNIQPTNNQSR